MKYTHTLIIVFFLLVTGNLLNAQSSYFQQEVNYKINVTLDDIEHTITGNIEIDYTNNSPDTLKEIYFHLWPNAFQKRTTAYANQEVKNGDTRFYFAPIEKRGNISNLNFKVDGNSTEFKIGNKNPDQCRITLSKPLLSGQSIKITTPFIVKIPDSFSRLGHVGQSYQMTQWFPKPAVYDHKGWHRMSYLDMGEFYSEFGSFDVSITLPANYVVGATGELQTESEKNFLKERVAKTNKFLAQDTLPDDLLFPVSASNQKTIRYTAEKVHDFAWFADKRFHVQKSQSQLASGKMVDTWAMFTNLEAEIWKKGTDYLNRSVRFYSDKVGEYPYSHATAVESALSAGGGMEYPMITVIGPSGTAAALDEVITHEVGHNWFYGILAFNERDHSWMDEGINSYYEGLYMDKYYKGKSNFGIPDFFFKGSDMSFLEASYLYQARRNLNQAPETSSDDFNRINYFLSSYEIPARALKHLELYLGEQKLDAIMQGFYEEWKFKHPYPEDFQSYVQSQTNKDLSWFFEGLIYSKDKLDYSIKDLAQGDTLNLTVSNKGVINAPFPVSALRNDSIVYTKWFDGFEGTKTLSLENGNYDELVIDAGHNLMELNRNNNNIRLKGFLKKIEKPRFKLAAGLDNSRKMNFYWLPTVGYNAYDGSMFGGAIYNTLLPAKKFEFALAPYFTTGEGGLSGLGNIRYNIFPDADKIRKITFDLGVKSFNYQKNVDLDYTLRYFRFVPKIRIELGDKRPTEPKHVFQYRFIRIDEQIATFDTLGNFVEEIWEPTTINEFTYEFNNKKAVNPFSAKLTYENQNYESFLGEQSYSKASVEINTAYTYNVKKSIDLRLFAGAFLSNTRREAGNVSNRGTRGTWSLSHQGFNDYKYDDLFIGRNENTGIWSQQINIDQGGMKYAFGSPFQIGQSNSFIISANIKADLPQDLPLKLPLKPYLDLGYFKNAQPTGSDDTFQDQFLVSGGLMLEFFGDNLAIYFPIASTENLDLKYGERSEGKYFGRITWTVNLNELSPWKLVDKISF